MEKYSFQVEWCRDTQDYLATCDQLPELGSTDLDAAKALSKLIFLIEEIEKS